MIQSANNFKYLHSRKLLTAYKALDCTEITEIDLK